MADEAQRNAIVETLLQRQSGMGATGGEYMAGAPPSAAVAPVPEPAAMPQAAQAQAALSQRQAQQAAQYQRQGDRMTSWGQSLPFFGQRTGGRTSFGEGTNNFQGDPGWGATPPGVGPGGGMMGGKGMAAGGGAPMGAPGSPPGAAPPGNSAMGIPQSGSSGFGGKATPGTAPAMGMG